MAMQPGYQNNDEYLRAMYGNDGAERYKRSRMIEAYNKNPGLYANNDKYLRAVYGDRFEEYKKNRMREEYMRNIKPLAPNMKAPRDGSYQQ